MAMMKIPHARNALTSTSKMLCPSIAHTCIATTRPSPPCSPLLIAHPTTQLKVPVTVQDKLPFHLYERCVGLALPPPARRREPL